MPRLGYSQEYRAEQSMAALKRMSAPTVRVRREHQVREVSARDLVAGDVVLLETGNVVPADGRLANGSNLRVQEAALTGESEAVEKDAAIVFTSERSLGDRPEYGFLRHSRQLWPRRDDRHDHGHADAAWDDRRSDPVREARA